jgi:hypothetical protein
MSVWECNVTEFTATGTDRESGDRPIAIVRVQLASRSEGDPIGETPIWEAEFFLEPPQALELADKLRAMALRVGR